MAQAIREIPNGFIEIEAVKPVKRVIMSHSGHEKSGKTDWILRTAPEPVFHFILDPNARIIAEKMKREFPNRQLYRADLAYDTDDNQAAWEAQWGKLKQLWSSSLQTSGTLLIDSGTEWYELVRLARFGRLTQVMPQHYGPLNAELKDMIREAYDSSASVIFLHKMRKVYEKNNWTGEWEPSMWSDMPFQVQVNSEAWRDDPAFTNWNGKAGVPAKKDGAGRVTDPGAPFPFHVYIKDCNLNMTLAGKDFTTDMVTFEVFLQMACK